MTPAQLKKQRQRLARIIAAWAGRLRLDAWDLEVLWDEEPEDPEALASVSPSDLYDQAQLRFRRDWMTHSNHELNRIVVHELMHVLFRDLGNAARSIHVTGCTTADARALWHDRCNDAEEGLIDRLANRFVELAGEVE